VFVGNIKKMLKQLGKWRAMCEKKKNAEPCKGKCLKGLEWLIRGFKHFKKKAAVIASKKQVKINGLVRAYKSS